MAGLTLFVAESAIMERDVTAAFFDRFAGDVWTSAGSSRARQDTKAFLRGGVAAVQAVRRKEVEAFFAAISIDNSFERFVQWCRDRSYDVYVLSDGLSYCLEAVFRSKGIEGVQLFANPTQCVQEGAMLRFGVSFPYDDETCMQCACCARNMMLTHSADDERIVFVGSNERDACPASYADVVFAKGALQRCCQQRNISYLLYASFDDVVQRLAQPRSVRRVKLRREAAMLRREAFMAE
ncbi:MAG: hypothetical protein C4326_10685 [Ignavibacteria bacterium]